MIPVRSGVRVWLAVGRTDMRKGMNGLALQVQQALGRDPHAGGLYVFRGSRPHPTSFSIPFAIYCRGISPAPASGRARSGLRAARPGRPPDSVYRGAAGLSRELPAWMGDAAVCAAISTGSARVAIAHLNELRAVLDGYSA